MALRELGALVDSWTETLTSSIGLTASELFSALAAGQIKSSPFPSELVSQWSSTAVTLLDYHGLQAGSRADDRNQCIHIRWLQAILRGGDDPDVPGMDHFARGVKLGTDVKLNIDKGGHFMDRLSPGLPQMLFAAGLH